jgi:hypothetical protein
MVRGSFDGKAEPTPSALANMVAWLNARQAGVNRARAEIGQQGVHVYHAAEINRVVQSMDSDFPNMVNKVLPHTKLDLISYSAWDSVTARYADPNVLRNALDFIAAHAPDSADFGSRNVYLGEFGMPENSYRPEQIQTAVSNAVRTGLDWGCPYIIYWQLYCNELKDPNATPPVTSNDAVKGFWLIRPDGTKSWVWHYFHQLFEAGNPVTDLHGQTGTDTDGHSAGSFVARRTGMLVRAGRCWSVSVRGRCAGSHAPSAGGPTAAVR